MLKIAVKAHFGNQRTIAKELDISESAVSQWGERIPEFWARKLSELTGGKLKYDPAAYTHPPQMNKRYLKSRVAI